MLHIAATKERYERQAGKRPSTWYKDYLLRAAICDFSGAALGVLITIQIRFDSNVDGTYLALTIALPALWVCGVWLAGGYDVRFIGTGSDEFRKVLNARVGLTAAVVFFSYIVNFSYLAATSS